MIYNNIYSQTIIASRSEQHDLNSKSHQPQVKVTHFLENYGALPSNKLQSKQKCIPKVTRWVIEQIFKCGVSSPLVFLSIFAVIYTVA